MFSNAEHSNWRLNHNRKRTGANPSESNFSCCIGERDNLKTQCVICYSVSDVANLVRDTLNSLKTLRQYVDKEEVVVFYTPPLSERNSKLLSKYALVEKTENFTEPFRLEVSLEKGRYGEKIHLCDLNSPNVIFLDSDTWVKKSPFELLEGDFDFSGRVDDSYLDVDFNAWNQLFETNGKKPIPLINTGVLVFKNNMHKKVKNEWLRFFNMKIPHLHPYFYQKDEYALTLAVSDMNIKWMSASEHAYRWKREYFNDTCILHGKKRGLWPIAKGVVRELAFNRG